MFQFQNDLASVGVNVYVEGFSGSNLPWSVIICSRTPVRPQGYQTRESTCSNITELSGIVYGTIKLKDYHNTNTDLI